MSPDLACTDRLDGNPTAAKPFDGRGNETDDLADDSAGRRTHKASGDGWCQPVPER
jgi:hypothetical protein